MMTHRDDRYVTYDVLTDHAEMARPQYANGSVSGPDPTHSSTLVHPSQTPLTMTPPAVSAEEHPRSPPSSASPQLPPGPAVGLRALSSEYGPGASAHLETDMEVWYTQWMLAFGEIGAAQAADEEAAATAATAAGWGDGGEEGPGEDGGAEYWHAACAHLQAGIALRPDFPKGYLLLAKAFLQLGERGKVSRF